MRRGFQKPRLRGPGPLTRMALLWVALPLAVACGDGLLDPADLGPADLSTRWRTAEASALGMDEGALDRAVRQAEDIGRLRSLLVVRDGHLALERYFGGFAKDSVADVRSVTKSVVSTLVGIALDRGELASLDTPIGDILTPSVVPLSDGEAVITIRNLLTMSGGWLWDESEASGYNEWITSGEPVGYLLARPLESAPGTDFTYNSAAVHLLGIVLEEALGRPLPDYADEHLFGPLGITNRTWEPLGGRVNGGAGIDLRPRDLARLGQLFLQEGRSGDEQILPASWVQQATAPAYAWSARSGPLTDLSYGYLWWVDRSHDAYLAWGYGGQFIYVVPERALVVVATTDWRMLSQDEGSGPVTNAVLDVIVNGIVPAAPVR